MSPVDILDGPGSAARRRRRRSWVIAGVVLGIVIVAGSVAAFAPRPGGPSAAGRLGPYTLSTINVTTIDLGFPRCSVVTATWNVTGPGNETYTVWDPASPTNSTCASSGPNLTIRCPHQGCPSYLDRQPVCIESGPAGSCEFQSTQTNYTFLLYTPYDQTPFAALSFTASYT